MRNHAICSMIMAGLFVATVTVSHAAEYCCTCDGDTSGKTIEASSRISALGKCSVQCGKLSIVSSGQCAVAATPVPAGMATVVLLFKSEDCSGDPATVSKSTPTLNDAGIDGIYSMSVESGDPAAGWEKRDFGGRTTGLMGPTICVSPGFEIQGVRIGGR